MTPWGVEGVEATGSREVGGELVKSELSLPVDSERHSQKSVVIYLSHPSDSNSYTLRCLYILTLGLQGHNLKGYPVKNVEKYKIKIGMFGGKANEGRGQNTRK